MKTTALVPWFGSNRMLAHTVAQELHGCKWVGIPFAGGMSELTHIKASTIVVNDLHRHVMNLAMCVASPKAADRLATSLADMPFHPDTLAIAQAKCLEMERVACDPSSLGSEVSEVWALNYFVSQWMGRSGKAGTKDELRGKLPIRWNANGGDSNTRFRSAVTSLAEWSQIMRRCNFSTLDVFEFLDRFTEHPRHGIYCDPPFPDAGGEYKHAFSAEQHRRLASRLAELSRSRVVCRFYDHPLIRELYPRPRWTWRHQRGRKQTNEASPEILVINGPS